MQSPAAPRSHGGCRTLFTCQRTASSRPGPVRPMPASPSRRAAHCNTRSSAVNPLFVAENGLLPKKAHRARPASGSPGLPPEHSPHRPPGPSGSKPALYRGATHRTFDPACARQVQLHGPAKWPSFSWSGATLSPSLPNGSPPSSPLPSIYHHFPDRSRTARSKLH